MAILAAKGEKEKLTLEAEGKLKATLAQAEGVLALGKSEAEAQKLRLEAYAVQGTDAFVTVEVAKQMAEVFRGIQGYLPGDMNVTLLSDSFMKGVTGMMNGGRELMRLLPTPAPLGPIIITPATKSVK